MLRKENRATTAQVRDVVSKGVTRHSSNFSVRTLETSAPTTTFSVVVSKKIASTAVLRNLLKRRIKSVLPTLPLFKRVSVVIYVKKGVVHMSVPEIKKELAVLLSV